MTIMDKKDIIYKFFSDKNKTLDDLTKDINIEDFVGGLNILDKGKIITYGANVRLNVEANSDIIPFNYSNVKSFDAKVVAKNVEDGFRIPDFLTRFGLQEILFRVDFKINNNTIKVLKINCRSHVLNPYRDDDNEYINKDDDNDTINNKLFEDFFDKSSNTFLHENLLALFSSSPSSNLAHVWVLGEDPDTKAGDGRFLTHILAISDDTNKFNHLINYIRISFLEFVIILKSRKSYDAIERKEAIKAAKAAIMSRNMSHNLGSHVMSYLKTNLGSVKSILKDNVLSVLLKDEKLNPTLFNTQQFNTDKLTLPFLVGLGRFISYLQERQDYIATVSTNYNPYYFSVNFKDFIYDELNSDKRYERHPDRTNLKPDNILLGNIARSEGLGRYTSPTNKDGSTLSNIVLKFRSTFDGSPVERLEYEDQSGSKHVVVPELFYKEKVNIAKDELYQMRQYEFSLPGGTVGRQAIFSIIENVIRNAAKHGNWREQGQLELTMDIFTKEDVENEQPNDELKKRLPIDDQADDKSLSLKEVLKKFYNGEGSYDYYLITLTENLVSTPDSLKELRKALHEEYVNINNRMLETNKGIKEMRISAAWLRSLGNDLELCPFNESNDGKGEKEWGKNWDKQPPVLYIRLSKDHHNQCHLQYIFCIMRPKKVAFVSSRFDNQSHDGYFFLSPKQYLRFPNKNFEFVVYLDEKIIIYKRDMIAKKRKKEEENTHLNKGLFEAAMKKFEEEMTLLEKARCLSSQRFYKLSELWKEDYSKAIKDIDELISDINTIKNGPEEDVKKKTEEGFKKKTGEIYLRLYQHLSGWDGKEKILIDDGKAELQHHNEKKSLEEGHKYASTIEEKKEYKKKIENLLTPKELTFNLNTEDNDNIKYWYIRHLEEKREFKKKAINYNKELDFSEGITGDNSTDRLVRNESKTKLWFYKHLHAMKQQVAIFDERIFSKVTGLDESDFVSPGVSWGKDLKADKKYLKSQFSFSDKDKRTIDKKLLNRKQLERFIEKRNLKLEVSNCPSDIKKADAQNHMGATYIYKKLFIFSFIRSIEDTKCFNLYGINIDKGKPNYSECIKYATISWNDSKKQLVFNPSIEQRPKWMKFHSLSIHQGLLDKFYAAFGIQKEDVEAKENLTKDLYEYFIIDAKKQMINLLEDKDKDKDKDPKISRYFLPGMVIHSGRSKPSKEDMPQRLPFIPYSAIEQAVLDCKYSIVELLDYARYE
jgi:hypothetical protein